MQKYLPTFLLLILSSSWLGAQSATDYIYVTNEDSGDLSVISAPNFALLTTIPVGQRPRGLKISPDGKTVFVALSGSPKCPPSMPDSVCDQLKADKTKDGIAVVSVADRRVLRVLPGGSDPEQFDISPDGKRLYIANEDAHTMTVLDIKTGAIIKTIPVGREPEGVTVSPDGRLAYITSETDHSVSVIDAATLTVKATIKVGIRPRSIAFSPDGKRAYVSGEFDRSVSEINVATSKVLSRIRLPDGALPMGIVVSKSAKTLFVANGRGKTVSEINLTTRRVVRSLEVGKRPWGLALSPDGRYLYTANGPSNDATVIDVAAWKVLQRVPTGANPWGVVVGPAQSAGSSVGQTLLTGADQTARYLPALRGKRVGMVVNQTSTIRQTHLVDSLNTLGITIKTIFAPEHGFRGQASAGEKISNSRDPKTGIGIVSLYGSNHKPTPAQLDSLDVVVFDIQDVGVRFYTYISTLQYVMEACAETNKPLILLDRPNPNGHYVDGPVLDTAFKSFVGMHPIPIVHGLTVGELAGMINGEWLAGKKTCAITVIPCQNYTHQTPYTLPIAPSPNLPNLQSILLYPSLCLFEGTVVSVGRGTDTQFQVIGSPNPANGPYQFTPEDKPGAANPPNEGKRCYGVDLTKLDARKLGFSLAYLLDFYQKSPDKDQFFLKGNFIDKLYGSDSLRVQVRTGATEKTIRQSWEPALGKYKVMRKRYLLYP